MDVLDNGTIDESFLEAHDMVTCKVSIERTDYNERIELTIINTDCSMPTLMNKNEL